MTSREEALAWAKPLLAYGGMPSYISKQPGTQVAFTYTGPGFTLRGPIQCLSMENGRPQANWSTLSGVTRVHDVVVPELTWHRMMVPEKPVLVMFERWPTEGPRHANGIVVAPGDHWPLLQLDLARLHIASEGYLNRKMAGRILKQYRCWPDVLAGVRLAVFSLNKLPNDPERLLRRIGQNFENGGEPGSILPAHLQEIAAREPASRAKILEIAMTTLARRSR